jgi:hypothetical protein
MTGSTFACVAYFSAAWSCDSVVSSSPWIIASATLEPMRLNWPARHRIAPHGDPFVTVLRDCSPDGSYGTPSSS